LYIGPRYCAEAQSRRATSLEAPNLKVPGHNLKVRVREGGGWVGGWVGATAGSVGRQALSAVAQWRPFRHDFDDGRKGALVAC
jgi:hypothetical protein